MEKRVVIFLLLSLAIIFGYDYLLKELGWLPPPSQEAEAPEAPTADKPADDTGGATPPAPSVPAPSRPMGPKEIVPSGPQASTEQIIEVETDLIRARLSNRGAVVASWELKRYQTAPPDQQPVELTYSKANFKRPLHVTLPDVAATKELGEAYYKVERDFSVLTAAQPVGHVTFRYQSPSSDLRMEKQLTFHHGSYLVDVAISVEGQAGPMNVGLGTNFGIVEWGEGFIGLIGSALMVDGKIEKETPDGELERKGAVQWVALQDKYFLSVLIPREGSAALVKKEGDKIVTAAVQVPGQAGSPAVLQLYAGPKEYDTLRNLNIGLEDTIDFGWFIFGSWSVVKAVAKPIFYVLRFIYDFTHNYGLTIILLTVAIKLLFVPLQYKSYKSMKQMQVIQPKVQALQEKFKDDRDRLNKELIKLYRDQRVNPVGGCLPMVLQMPVFVALFNILYMTIDLRQAPFMLWIQDLSAQDPYYVLPLIMGASMVIQQKITPTTMDPTQAKIMLVLPVFMTFLFVNFPAGLVLYWLTNNVLTITQQLLTERYFSRRQAAVPSQAGT